MYVVWNVSPEAFRLGGFEVGWYGLLFALGFVLSRQVVIFMYAKERKPEGDHEALLWYLIVGTIAGARLGHCLFYDPEYFFLHPLDVLKVWEGGLASHGAVAGMIAALYLFSRRTKDQGFLWLCDRVAIVALITGALVRVGNFVNSEVIGTPTHSAFGVVFAHDISRGLRDALPTVRDVSVGRGTGEGGPGRVPLTILLDVSDATGGADDVRVMLDRTVRSTLAGDPRITPHVDESPASPLVYSMARAPWGYRVSFSTWGIARHPVQLYEALLCALLAAWLYHRWWKQRSLVPPGSILGWCLALLFSGRFLLEFCKEPLASAEAYLPASLGQILSIPFVLLGVWLILRTRRRSLGHHTRST